MKNLLALAIFGGKQGFCPQVGCDVGDSMADAPSTFTSGSRAVLDALRKVAGRSALPASPSYCPRAGKPSPGRQGAAHRPACPGDREAGPGGASFGTPFHHTTLWGPETLSLHLHPVDLAEPWLPCVSPTKASLLPARPVPPRDPWAPSPPHSHPASPATYIPPSAGCS